jgi:hypothetical protein
VLATLKPAQPTIACTVCITTIIAKPNELVLKVKLALDLLLQQVGAACHLRRARCYAASFRCAMHSLLFPPRLWDSVSLARDLFVVQLVKSMFLL